MAVQWKEAIQRWLLSTGLQRRGIDQRSKLIMTLISKIWMAASALPLLEVEIWMMVVCQLLLAQAEAEMARYLKTTDISWPMRTRYYRRWIVINHFSFSSNHTSNNNQVLFPKVHLIIIHRNQGRVYFNHRLSQNHQFR